MFTLATYYLGKWNRPIIYFWATTVLLLISQFWNVPFLDQKIYNIVRLTLFATTLILLLISAINQLQKRNLTYGLFSLLSVFLGIFSFFIWFVLIIDVYDPFSDNILDKNQSTDSKELYEVLHQG